MYDEGVAKEDAPHQTVNIGSLSVQGSGNAISIKQNVGSVASPRDDAPADAVPSADVDPQSAPTKSSLRRFLRKVLPTIADLDAFCIDFFPAVHARYSSEMDRVVRENLLLTVEVAARILSSLRQHAPEQYAEHVAIIKYE